MKRFFTRTAKGGFTLIELLVVIAIIGILSSVVLASLNSARTKARDARRVADLKQIQIALELYNDANSKYPAALSALTSPTSFISVVPTDPQSNGSYFYAVNNANPTAYHLGATLEQAISATTLGGADRDLNSLATGVQALSWPTSITGSVPFDGHDDINSNGVVIYDVSNQ